MDPNDSKRGFDVFSKSINSIKFQFYSKLEYMHDTIRKNRKMIKDKIMQIKRYMGKYDDNKIDNGNDSNSDSDTDFDNNNDNDELVKHLKNLKLFSKIIELLLDISNKFQLTYRTFRIPLFFCKQNTHDTSVMINFYETIKIGIHQYNDIILLNLNYAKYLILQLPNSSKNIEYLDVFVNDLESCLLCRNSKNENLVVGLINVIIKFLKIVRNCLICGILFVQLKIN